MKKWQKIIAIIFPIIFLIGTVGGIYWVISGAWEKFNSLEEKVALALLTAATTIIVSTLAVVLGRYYERKKDIEANFREKKIIIYDDFLKEFFEFVKPEDDKKKDLVPFLWEWQRKMILWGGQDVVKTYIDWIKKLKSGEVDAKSFWLMEDFFRAMRKDLGHSTWKLTKGTFMSLILKNPDLFIMLSNKNPNITLSEIGKIEKELDEKNKPR